MMRQVGQHKWHHSLLSSGNAWQLGTVSEPVFGLVIAHLSFVIHALLCFLFLCNRRTDHGHLMFVLLS